MAATLPNMGLHQWNLPGDPFSYTELADDFLRIDNHDHTTGKGLQIPTGGIANLGVTGPKIAADAIDASKILDGSVGTSELANNAVTTAKILNANVTADKLIDAAKIGLSDSTSVRRGKSIIAGTGTRTNIAYGALDAGAAPGPDRVPSIVLPTDGLIFVSYWALWQESVANAARAAIFLNSTQLRSQVAVTGVGSGPAVQEAVLNNSTTGIDVPLVSFPLGLASARDTNSTGATTSEVTTGQVVGGYGGGGLFFSFGSATINLASGVGGSQVVIFAAAGTYDVSVQFKASSGTVSAKSRKLWVRTLGF